MFDFRDFERHLPDVQQPGQYTGGEWGAVAGDFDAADLRVALVFPDTYAVGISHWGLRVLYHAINSRPGWMADRAYLAWTDMLAIMERERFPAYGIESRRPLAEFDVIGITYPDETLASNILKILALSRVPLSAAKRTLPADPLVVIGGSGVLNPTPLEDFADLFVIGDGEEAFPAVLERYVGLRRAGLPKREILLETVRGIGGVYAPALYAWQYDRDGRVVGHAATVAGVPERIEVARVRDLDAAPWPIRPVVPNVEAVHDRAAVEIMRGCPHFCRFCQAGFTRRPRRIRKPETIRKLAVGQIDFSGWEEVGLLSLSSGDYPALAELIPQLTAEFDRRKVNLSLPSLRISDELKNIPALMNTVKKAGLTLAPEAATERMRRVINKNITDDELLTAVETAFSEGWRSLKLYFMVGFPHEEEEDVVGIVRLAEKISDMRRGGAEVRLSVNTFIPKPHTPFQWERMIGMDEMEAKRRLLYDNLRKRRVKLSFNSPDETFLQGVLSRGDARLGAVVRRAHERGAAFDAWSEARKIEAWRGAFSEVGVSPEWYLRERDESEMLPWQIVDPGVKNDFLLRERRNSARAAFTGSCGAGSCPGCGVPGEICTSGKDAEAQG